jgi:hypothetical protein
MFNISPAPISLPIQSPVEVVSATTEPEAADRPSFPVVVDQEISKSGAVGGVERLVLAAN